MAAFGLLAAQIQAQVVPGPGTSAGPSSVIIGQVQTATGGPVNYGALTFSLSQPAIIAGTASIATEQSACYTSAQGNVVGVPDALATPVLSVNLSAGTLPAGTYYVVIYYIGAGGVGAISPEASINLSNQGTLYVSAPGVQPSSATGYYGVAISTTSGGETIQGVASGWTQYAQSIPLVTGSTPQALNTSFCSVYLSDQLVPTGTYYTVNLVNKNGSQISGFPQTWCMYGGAAATINISNGAPTGNCSTSGVFYPTPIFANPPNTLVQSIASGLNIGGTLNVAGNTTLQGTLKLLGTFLSPNINTPTINSYLVCSSPGTYVSYNNAVATGTLLNSLVTWASGGSNAVVPSISQTGGVLGIACANPGTTGIVNVQQSGIALCNFDSATTANDYVQISSTVAGDCHDAGAAYPSSGQILGRVEATAGSAGTYGMTLFGPEIHGYTYTVPLLTANGTASDLTYKIVAFTVTLSGGTFTQTLSGGAIFPTTPKCWGNDETGANAVKVVASSGSSVTVTGTSTDSIDVWCMTPPGIF